MMGAECPSQCLLTLPLLISVRISQRSSARLSKASKSPGLQPRCLIRVCILLTTGDKNDCDFRVLMVGEIKKIWDGALAMRGAQPSDAGMIYITIRAMITTGLFWVISEFEALKVPHSQVAQLLRRSCMLASTNAPHNPTYQLSSTTPTQPQLTQPTKTLHTTQTNTTTSSTIQLQIPTNHTPPTTPTLYGHLVFRTKPNVPRHCQAPKASTNHHPADNGRPQHPPNHNLNTQYHARKDYAQPLGVP